MTSAPGRHNAVSRIIGQEKMLAFLESAAPRLSEDELTAAKEFLSSRKEAIKTIFLKYLTDDAADTRYKELLNSLDESKVQKRKKPLSFLRRKK